jgi:hypothetical protein
MDTTNLSPDTAVPVGGLYHCCMCIHGDPMLKSALNGHAKEKGMIPSYTSRLLRVSCASTTQYGSTEAHLPSLYESDRTDSIRTTGCVAVPGG